MRRKTGRSPITTLRGVRGVVTTDPAGHPTSLPFNEVAAAIGVGVGAGDVVGPASATDNAIARYDTTTGKLLQNSAPIVQDDGRISIVTDPTSPQDAATKNYVDTEVAGVTAGGLGAADIEFAFFMS